MRNKELDSEGQHEKMSEKVRGILINVKKGLKISIKCEKKRGNLMSKILESNLEWSLLSAYARVLLVVQI